MPNKRSFFLATLVLFLGYGNLAYSQPVISGGAYTQVAPTGPIEMQNVVIPGQTTRNYDRYFIVNVRHSCFGTLVRGTATNHVVPNADIDLRFTLARSSGNTSVRVQYPAGLAAVTAGTVGIRTAQVIPAGSKVPGTMRAAAFGNVLRLEIPISTSPTIGPDGLVIANAVPHIRNYTFAQIVDPLSGTYSFPCIGTTGISTICSVVGRSGNLPSKVNIMQATGSYSAEMQVSLPGHSEYCSGHF